MQLPLDLDLQFIPTSPGVSNAMRSITAKRGTAAVVSVPVVQGKLLAEDAVSALQLRLVIKQPGFYDQTPLIPYPDFEWNAATKQYEALVNWSTAYLNGQFGIQSDPVTLSGGVASTDLITASAPHLLAVNNRVWFPALTGGAGLTAAEGHWYYVIAAGLTSTDFSVSATLGGAAVNFTTDISAGSVRLDPVDVSSVALVAVLQWRFSNDDDWSESDNDVALTLKNNYGRPEDGSPADPAASVALSWLDGHAVRYEATQALTQADRIQVLDNTQILCDALTGGAAGALDSILTAGGALSTGRLLCSLIAGVLTLWELDTGTDAEDAPNGIVRPDDYDGSTNARVWRRRTITTTTPVLSTDARTGTAETLVLANANQRVTMNNASANTLTVPTNASVAFVIGTQILVEQIGAGLTSIAAAGGVTLHSRAGLLDSAGRYAVLCLIKTAADTWTLTGDRA